MRLVIVESPIKRNRIQHMLGQDFLVIASSGHIRDLPLGSFGIDLGTNDEVRMHYVLKEQARDGVIPRILAKSAQAQEVILATDPDREGEAIAWHLMQVIGPHTYSRARFHAITPEEITSAIANRGRLDHNLVDAQQARRAIDRFVGFCVSSLCRKTLGVGARSAGRVQSVAVRLLVEREREIKSFEKSPFFEIWTTLQAEVGSATWAAKLIWFQGVPLEKGFPTRPEADAAVATVSAYPIWHVINRTQKPANRHAPAPYTTSTIQQDASVRLNLRPDECMKILQELYENGAITFHRTDSVMVTPEAIAAIRQVITTIAPDLLPLEPIVHVNQVPGSQEAHEAIRPTDPARTGKDLGISPTSAAVYDLVRLRALASQCIAGEDTRTELLVGVWRPGRPSEQIDDILAIFRGHGSTCRIVGWRRLAKLMPGEAQDDDDPSQGPVMPDLDIQSPVAHSETGVVDKMTRPPKRYTQASLIRRLEKERVGRPSTFAHIMTTIIDRGYAIDEQRNLIATPSGIALVDYLMSCFPGDFIEVSYTGQIENDFDAIASGVRPWGQVVSTYARSLIDRCRQLGMPETVYGQVIPRAPRVIDMPAQPRFLPCRRCQAEITLVRSEGRTIPVNPDASEHRCERSTSSSQPAGPKPARTPRPRGTRAPRPPGTTAPKPKRTGKKEKGTAPPPGGQP